MDAPATPRPRYTGFLRRSEDGQGIVGTLFDFCCWPIHFVGTPGERDGRRGYVLTGTLGEPPEAMRFPAIDGPPAGDAEDGASE